MPYAYDPDSAVVIDSQVAIDSEVGPTEDLDGLIVNSIGYKATRQEKEKFNVLDSDVATLSTRPRHEYEIDGEVTLIASPFVAHPGKAIDRTVLLNLGPATAMGAPARGYYRYGQPDMSAKPGDLFALKVTLRQVFLPVTAFHTIVPPATA